jgi:mitochondrial inner membrane protease subunit 1
MTPLIYCGRFGSARTLLGVGGRKNVFNIMGSDLSSIRVNVNVATGRSFIAAGKRHGYKRSKRRSDAAENNVGNENAKNPKITHNNSTTISPTVVQINHSTNLPTKLINWILPVRYRFTKTGHGSQYSRDQAFLFLQRLPIWMTMAVLFSWEETSPYSFITIHGPSMLPTMAADGSDVWLRSTWTWWRKIGFDPPYRLGDLVGFAHPDDPHHVSCKRIVGLPGDRVQRYGQYVHLYSEQDPDGWGIMWPDSNHPTYKWIDPTCPWDDKKLSNDDNSKSIEMKRTLLVPDGHVWVEADCPALGIDSRHFGPIPVAWLRGKIVAKVWPFWMSSTTSSLSRDKRPHPIPLDNETLMEYNVFRASSTTDLNN